MSLNESLR